MSISSLLSEVGISLEDLTPVPLVAETVVSPTIEPSAAIEVPGGVVSTEEPVIESVAAPGGAVAEAIPPVAEVVEPVVETVVPAPEVAVMPVAEAQAALIESEIAQVEATAGQIEAEQAAIKMKADELLEIQTSLESLQVIIRKSGANGISNQTAQVVQLQLRNVNRILGNQSATVSTESFNSRDPREQFGVAKIALEDIRTSLKVSKNKFFALVERLIDFFKKVANTYLDGINALEKKVDSLEERLGALKSSGHKGNITIHNAGLVLHDDSLDIPADIPGLAHFCAVGYPEALVKYLDQSTKTILRFTPDKFDREQLVEEFTRFERPLTFLLREKANEDELPGGYKLDIDQDALTFGLKGEAPAGVTHECELMSTVQLRRKARDLKALIAQVKEIRPEVDKINKAANKLMEAAKRVTSKKSEDANQDDYDAVMFSAAVRALSTKPRIDEVIKYLVRYINMQIAISNTMADAIEAGKQNK